MDEETQAYVDAKFAELREYIDMRLDDLQNATLSNIQEALAIVPRIVADTLGGSTANEDNVQTNK